MSQLVPISIEAVCVEVTKPKMKPFFITSIYRPPNSKVDFMDNLENYLNELDKQNSELIISGDLNCDLSISDLQPQSRRLMDIFQLFQLKQLIVEPTRITDDTETLLDIIATNRPDKVKDSGVIHLGISDHSLVYLCLKVSVSRDKPKIVDSRNMKYYSKESMNDHLYHELNNFSWEQTDPNILWEQFKNIFNSVSDVHAPIKTRKVRSTYAPWLTTDIRHEMNQRDYLKKKEVKSKSKSLFKAYKAQRNRINKLIKSAKSNYCKREIDHNKNNPKEMWKQINQVISGKGRCSKTTTITTIKNDQGNFIQDDKLIADEFNKYFTEVGAKLSNQIVNASSTFLDYLTPVNCEFHFAVISNDTILKKISKIKPNKALGLDNISGKLLKDTATVVTPFLNLIFNLSLAEGIFPSDWKNARVSPIYKSGSRDECSNYRPISVLSTISKIFEKIVFDQMNEYFASNAILTPYQSGFRKGYSTMTSLLKTTNEWLVNMDKGLINGVVFLDLKKAFDTVDHDILIKKLEFYGIKNIALRWFISYLSRRKQVCKICSSISEIKTITTGVPQGSNLGPLLFLLYINDLPNCLKSSVPALFADDTNLSVRGATAGEIEEKLKSDLNNVHNWLLTNKLTLNVRKTEYMLIGSRQKLSQVKIDPDLHIGSEGIGRVSSTKTLGVLVDENITWRNHIDYVAKKVAKGIGLLRRSKDLLEINTLKTIYNATVLPYFDYCALVWDNYSQTIKHKLEKLHNKAARIITGDSDEIRSDAVRSKLGWVTLQERRDKIMSKLMKQIVDKKSIDYLQELFTISSNSVHSLGSNNCSLLLPKPNTNALKRSFSYRGAAAWNNPPLNERTREG